MDWIAVVALCASLAAILGSPIAFAVYLGNKLDNLSKDMKEESWNFREKMRLIEERRKK